MINKQKGECFIVKKFMILLIWYVKLYLQTKLLLLELKRKSVENKFLNLDFMSKDENSNMKQCFSDKKKMNIYNIYILFNLII